ncbi:MAG TPA: YkgJ family cysteine cluster protein [Tepidisphaeraceae bacterium]|nr:YkgJ family cysteine cluster protein [Tepidisphaeraceae bacterium]
MLARQAEDENWQFRQFLKTRCRLDSDELDQRVFEITHQVWAGIDCTTCANCCRTVHPTFNDEDVARLSARLGVTREQFIETYLQPADSDGENPWQTRTTPCPFLKDNRCTIYEDRPADCRGYPYLYEPGFVFRIMAMIERTHTCPIVYEVMEALKPATGFRPGRR